MRDTFHLFAYGTLLGETGNGAALLGGCERVGPATVHGALYDIGGCYPALVLAGSAPVHGEIWRCPLERLRVLDRHEGVADGLFRRVGVRAGDIACWAYVAGPRLTRELLPERRIAGGRWSGGGGTPA